MGKFIFNYGNIQFKDKTEVLDSHISGSDFLIGRNKPSKFEEDKIFEENKNYILLIDGVILNRNEFPLADKKLFNQLIDLYERDGEYFLKKLRGPFSGAIYDKKNNKWLIFTDHTGSKIIYYSMFDEQKIIVSSKLKDVLHLRKQNNLENIINENSAYMLLSYGYLITDKTLINNVSKILPGHYIIIENDTIKIKKYFQFTNNENHNHDDDEIIENVDRLFRKAVKRQFDKDKEYNYKNLVALSGGLDSRMTTVVANELGYKNQLNFTFSQTDYLDETIPKKIAEDLKHEWIFKSLDNGIFMKDIDEVSTIIEGNVSYYGVAHGNSLMKLLNFDSLGIVHTGQLGDVIIGTYSSGKVHKKIFNLHEGAFSKKYVSKINFKEIDIDYENEEMFKFYLRGFSGMNAGLLGLEYYTETMSPFYDIDFMEYCLAIPVKKRFGHKIYKKWINEKYPIATDYIWEKTRKKPKNNRFQFSINYKGKTITLTKILSKFRIKKSGLNVRNHMNPFQYWLDNNEDLRDFISTYFNDNIKNTNLSKGLENDIKELFKTGNIMEKGLVLSLLGFIKFNNSI